MKKANAIKPKAKKFLVPGESYFVQTVTNFYTGKLVRVEDDLLILAQVAWIADTGRFSGFMANGIANEVEPFPPELETGVPKSSIISVCPWKHSLLSEQK